MLSELKFVLGCTGVMPELKNGTLVGQTVWISRINPQANPKGEPNVATAFSEPLWYLKAADFIQLLSNVIPESLEPKIKIRLDPDSEDRYIITIDQENLPLLRGKTLQEWVLAMAEKISKQESLKKSPPPPKPLIVLDSESTPSGKGGHISR